MCYSSYLFKSCHRCRYRNQTVVSKVHTGLMTYENSRVSSRWGNSQGNLQQQVFRRCLHVCEWRIILNVRVFLRTSFFSLFFRNRCHHNRHKNDDWRANTVVNIVYCPVKNLKKKKKRGEKLRGHDFESVGRNVYAAKLYPTRKCSLWI